MKRPCLLILCLLLLNCIKGQVLDPSKTRITNGLLARDDEKQTLSYKRDNHDDDDRDKKKSKVRVTTEVDIIYTTIIYASASASASASSTATATGLPIPSVYNVSSTGSAHQEQRPEQSSPSTSLNDPSKKDNLAASLKDDQQALKRMIMILSLVGGLGVIAIVATIVIFTRMRAKNRKQREIDDDGNQGSTFEFSADVDRHSSASNASDNNNGLRTLATSNSSTLSLVNDRPSAPPALMMIDGSEPLLRNRRNVVSMSSQTTAPLPSAPTAKELDALEGDRANEASTSAPYHHPIQFHHHHHQQEQINSCARCTPMMVPELPPPAYTPSAPPHYALPNETDAIITSSPSSSLPSSRRHSFGG